MPAQPETPLFLVGTSLFFGVQVRGQDGGEYDLTNVTVSATVRTDKGRVKAAMDIEWIDRQHGRFVAWAPGNRTCAGWAPGDYSLRLIYTEAGAAFGGQPLVVGTELVPFTVYE